MRKIKNLINPEKKVYILLKNEAIRYRFMSDAAYEGITYGDGVLATERQADEIMALQKDGTICFLGWAGHMCYHHSKDQAIKIDYEKYVFGCDDYIMDLA